ncbi:MAG TPA: flagellar assembly protein FliW [Pirellulales bacterium]|nr:flagellar assembly protein FliW [Pirellulales bacterium]
MQIRTTRFGSLELEPGDTIQFPGGLLGLEDCRQWVLLADAQNGALGWLQSTTRPDVALAVVSPRRFVPHYQFRVYRSELAPLELAGVKDAQVLTIVGKNERSITLNLKAPIVINLERRLGRQVVANGDLPLQHELNSVPATLKKSA